ncbi:unnamed protein product [Fraxinus pennsylvanica]|uniref:CobW/HypB/UreG nucleotide-binding domain-containing protein n=1 Tax=Fraxinus pennsylvanica TaxID=56036 RepID=A0AAD2A336_9LAMI|nr:unnamed protein product [Fraxinus pennsylvanica]
MDSVFYIARKLPHIVIETTGLANPAPIIQTFYAEGQVFSDVKLDGIVTMVDAKHAGFHLDEIKPEGVVNEAVKKIAYADRIIVNKNINRMAQLKRTMEMLTWTMISELEALI